MKTLPAFFLLSLVACPVIAAEPPEPKFTAAVLDNKIQIGYGLAIADVDGDKLPDVLLADKRQIVWYRNPGFDKARDAAAWQKFLIAENLTEKDNVCIAAEDIDGDGKCEIAVGAEWNPSDTVGSGAVFYLVAPADRTQRWEPVKFPAVEPTTHRMRWLKQEDGMWGLVVIPLHGRGNKNGEGESVKVRLYHPAADPKAEWKSEVIDQSMHMTHNGWPLKTAMILAGKEGLELVYPSKGAWHKLTDLPGVEPIQPEGGVGEVCLGELAPKMMVFGTIEPMHGNKLVAYVSDGKSAPKRHLLTDKLVEGHALASGSLVPGAGAQIVVGWRGNPASPANSFGIHLWTPLDATGEKWRESVVDDGAMACEDLQLADLDGDGRLDIVASGRATKNLKLYFNDTPKP